MAALEAANPRRFADPNAEKNTSHPQSLPSGGMAITASPEDGSGRAPPRNCKCRYRRAAWLPGPCSSTDRFSSINNVSIVSELGSFFPDDASEVINVGELLGGVQISVARLGFPPAQALAAVRRNPRRAMARPDASSFS